MLRILAASLCVFTIGVSATAHAQLPDLGAWRAFEARGAVGGNTRLEVAFTEPVAVRAGFRSTASVLWSSMPDAERGGAVAEITAPDLATLYAGGALALLHVVAGGDAAAAARSTGIVVGAVRAAGSFRTIDPCWFTFLASTMLAQGGDALGARAASVARALGRLEDEAFGLLQPQWSVVEGRDSLTFTVRSDDGRPLAGVGVELVTAAGIEGGTTAADGSVSLATPADLRGASVVVSEHAPAGGAQLPVGPSVTSDYAAAPQ
jgi:hypothetical protein